MQSPIFLNEIVKFSAEREKYFQVMFVKIKFAEIPILVITKNLNLETITCCMVKQKNMLYIVT